MNITERIKNICEKEQFNGVVLVADHADVLFHQGFGYKDIASKKKMPKDAVFRIGSITKQFTAAAVLQLVEKGLLKLSDTLSDLIKDVPYDEEITVHHLLSNSSGIPNFDIYDDFKPLLASDQFHLRMIKEKIFKNPLNFKPGEKFEYSSSGFFILSYLIELISDMPYHEYLKKYILDPLHMTHTGFHFNEVHLEEFTSLYDMKDGEVVLATPFDMRIASGAGGLYSCALDLNKWHDGLLDHKILSKTYVDMMFDVQTKINETGGYGYGVISVKSDVEGMSHQLIYHPGNGPGVFAQNMIYDHHLKLVMLSNINDGKTFRQTFDLIHDMIKREVLR